ncbi:MAG: thioredoxin [Candidatus Nanoarchaeia archaeon]|jgi:thioredoxin 1|nr:thioredoxin [Candidatus Nanoarchaeia archaeon]MDD3994099.1 thioredoxin [Candidatus Nanoarchaeia archaeon]MDD4563528.1 thioredoxin [Candidatus Nanoarchaeia archaeon]
MVVKNLTNENFEIQVSNGITVVDFWAPWCGPCQMMAPVFEDLSNEFKDKINFAKVNVDENRNLSMQYNIQGIPTLLIFKEGELIDQITGFSDKSKLREKFNYLI